MSEDTEYFPKHTIVLTWITQGIACVIAKIFFSIFFSVKAEGLENVESLNYGPLIFASNHAHELDSVFIRTVLPLFSKTTTLFAVCKKHHEYDWQGWRRFIYSDNFFKALGAYPTNHGVQDYSKSLETIINIGKSGQTVLIFSGGKQYAIDEPVKNKGGTAYLSWATGLPVIPVAIYGTFNLGIRGIFVNKPKVVIKFGKAMFKNEIFSDKVLSEIDFKNESLKVTQQIENMRADLNNQYCHKRG